MSKRTFNIPALGIVGPENVREAFDGDLVQLRDLLQSRIKAALELSGEEDWWPHVHGLFPDFIVVEMKDGKLYRYSYVVDGTDVTLGAPMEVVKTFTPAGDGGSPSAAVPVQNAPAGPFIEAAGDKGVWRIRVVRSGRSGNGNIYPEAVLREAVPLFDGVRVFVKGDAEHLAGQGKDFRNLIGALKAPRLVEAAGAAGQVEIQADLHLIEPDGSVATKIREAWDHGLTDLFGFSMDTLATIDRKTLGGQSLREARKFLKVKSVDLIVEPGAHGGIVQLLEAKDELMNREEILRLLEAKNLLAGHDTDKMSDSELVTLLSASLREAAPGATDPDRVTRADLRLIEARADARALIAASGLPKAAQDRVTARFAEAKEIEDGAVATAIKAEADYIATFRESGRVTGLGDRIEVGETRDQKVQAMFDAFFDRQHRDARHVRSFKEAYIEVTGDRKVTGLLQNCDTGVMREALGTASFPEVLGDAIQRRMVADYNVGSQYDIWRQVADVVSISDFRTQHRVRYGGYGDLPAVAEAGDYEALASPTDEEATYAVTKRGGLETITMEMIKNDDVGVIRRLPTNLSRAAKRTLGKFTLDFLRANAAIYDGVNLFHADHGNLGAAALDKASLAAGRLAMLNQTEKDSDEKLGIGPVNLWVPFALEETGVDLFRRSTENDKTFTQSLALNVIPVWYWTDANDWYLSADVADIACIEIGFLDGDEEPALFIQDLPNVGSMFSSDQVTYKIRHVYGGAVVDHRGLYGARPA